MSTQPTQLVQLVAYYNDLLTRFALHLTGGNQPLAEAIVKDAMEEAWEQDKFYPGPALRQLLKNNVVAKALVHKQNTNNNTLVL